MGTWSDYLARIVQAPAMAPVAPSSVSDVVSDVGTSDAAHGALQAVCYRELMTQLRTCDPQVPWTGAGGLFARAAAEIDERRGEVVALEADNARLRAEVGRLRAIVRVNLLRHVPGVTHAAIDALLGDGGSVTNDIDGLFPAPAQEVR
jgi:hypothetical protein